MGSSVLPLIAKATVFITSFRLNIDSDCGNMVSNQLRVEG